MSDIKYSLAMIARNCADDLDRCLASYARYPDEIVIVNTAEDSSEKGSSNTESIAQKYGAKVLRFPWVDDFSKARQFSFDNCTNDYVMWLDADDTVEDGEKLDKNIREGINNGCGFITVEYKYEWDNNGQCTTQLRRERVVDRQIFEWREPIHEALCATRKCMGGEIKVTGGWVRHNQRREETEKVREKLDRNLGIFQKQYEDGECGIRPLYYWGNTLVGLRRFDEALEKYQGYIDRENTKSGHWPVTKVSMAECHRLMQRPMDAFQCAMDAISFDPRMPSAWVQAAEAMLMASDYDKAKIFAQCAIDLTPNAHLEMVNNPRTLKGRPHFILAVAFAHSGEIEQAEQHAQVALQMFPDDESMARIMNAVVEKRREQRRTQAFSLLKGEMDACQIDSGDLSRALEPIMARDPYWNNQVPKKRPEDSRTIAIVCGPSSFEWGPDSIEKGIGGSEEAVINMAREMSEAWDWDVEIYCQTPKIQRLGRVTWYPWDCWTGKNDDPIEVCIWWRGAALPGRMGGHAILNYLWLHDMPIQQDWERDAEDFYDGVFVLSDFHAKQYEPYVSAEKRIMSANGMDPALYVPTESLTNNPTRIIFPSAPQRGLQYLLPYWGAIRKASPDAEIHCFYGWNEAFHAHNKQLLSVGNKTLQNQYETIERLRRQDGVHWHGMVGQRELAEEFGKAGLWVYPIEFPEIFCISAIKAQAMGSVPIVFSDFSLKTIVQHGKKLDGPVQNEDRMKHMVDEIIWAMQHPEWQAEVRKDMIPWARNLTWGAVASQWDALFNKDLYSARPKCWERGTPLRLIRSQSLTPKSETSSESKTESLQTV